MQSLFLLDPVEEQPEESERKGARVTKVAKVVVDAKVAMVLVDAKVVEDEGDGCIAANDAEEGDCVNTTTRRKN